MNNLYRVFHKGLAGTRKLYPADESYLSKTIELIDQSPESDFYESIYLYNDSHLEMLKVTKTLAGIKDVKTDRIVFDFDSKGNPAAAKEDAMVVVARLKKYFTNENIRVFYSGGKGTHVEVHLTGMLTRKQFELIISEYAGDLKTFDFKVKDEQRLFRYPLTRHSSTKRFKIPLTIEQLNDLSIEQIEKLSLNTDHSIFHDVMNSYEIANIPEEMLKLKEKEIVKEVTLASTDKPDLSRKPRHLTPAKFVLQEGFFQDGERNEACMILASTYKYLGYNERHTYNIIKGTLALRAERLGHEGYDKGELYNTIIKPIYSPTWKGGTFSEDDGLLKLTTERYRLDKLSASEIGLVSLSSLADQYRDFAMNIDANTIKLGIDEIDQKLRITTSMLVAFLAAPSAGKSSVSFGILNALSKGGEKSIFFSMDMSIPQVYQRLIQRHTGQKSDTITDNYKNKRTAEVAHYEKILHDEYPNVKFCFRSGLSVDQIRDAIKLDEQMSGSLPRLVILDYLECINSGMADSTQGKAAVATALKGMANELGICIILLVQPRMMAGGPAGELNSYTDIKGSSVVSEASATVITMSRPGFSPKHPEDDNFVTINIVKNRMGELSSTDLHWNGVTGNIRTLSSEEENDLNALRAANAAEKNKKDEIY